MSVFMYFSGFESLHHWKDDVILPNSGVAKKNWWLLIYNAGIEFEYYTRKKYAPRNENM